LQRYAYVSSFKQSVLYYLQLLKAPLLLGLLCFIVYNANLRQIGAGDTFPARYLPLLLWQKGTLNLETDAAVVANGHSLLQTWNRPAGVDGKVTYFEPWAYWMVRTRQHQLASLYPVVTPVLVAPLYVPAVIWLNAHGWEQPQFDRMAELMEKFSASLLASVTTVLMYLVLRRDSSSWTFPLTLAFAFGTNTWMISSQALWQHGTGELLIALALLLVIVPASPGRTALLGAVCVCIAANRPPDALIAGAFILFTIWSQRRKSLWLLAGSALPLAALLYYNLVFVGHAAGAYGLIKPPVDFFQTGWRGLSGLLLSPARGLLVFSPFLFFVPVGLIQRLRSPDSRWLTIALSFAVAAQVLLYSQLDWRAGYSWGPRWLTDVLPILVWLLAPAPLVLRPLTRGLLILTMVASVTIQTIGAFWYSWASDERLFAGNPASMEAAWDPKNIPFLTELSHPPAPGELQCGARGSIDRVGSTLLSSPGLNPDLESGMALDGWALACGRSPAEVLILIDGVIIGSTMNFQTRADVNEAMHTTSPSAWHISADLQGVSPGEHVLQLAVRIEPRSYFRIVREQIVLVIADEPLDQAGMMPQNLVSGTDLAAMAERATKLLRERQATEGYWLTSYTGGPRYEVPQQEMNTFLTSMLVDILSPVARQRGLEEMVTRAHQHLASQIEDTGLVRYHGLPDGPTIGTLGCVITPDADDTALVWRIAGRRTGDPREQRMLEELASYRDARGFYRTWLAPQQQYQCIDPGIDPNPTDIAIQMHVYLMLRELDQPAAQNLCNALLTSFWDGDIWVYYSKAPLVPYLRAAELRKLGCIIPLPTERLTLPAGGQEIWGEAIHQLTETAVTPPDTNTKQAIRELLLRIGKDDFAQLHSSPPLLYHNDLSASVSRYYWSEDFGYALWLRLYEAVGVETGNVQQP